MSADRVCTELGVLMMRYDRKMHGEKYHQLDKEYKELLLDHSRLALRSVDLHETHAQLQERYSELAACHYIQREAHWKLEEENGRLESDQKNLFAKVARLRKGYVVLQRKNNLLQHQMQKKRRNSDALEESSSLDKDSLKFRTRMRNGKKQNLNEKLKILERNAAAENSRKMSRSYQQRVAGMTKKPEPGYKIFR